MIVVAEIDLAKVNNVLENDVADFEREIQETRHPCGVKRECS